MLNGAYIMVIKLSNSTGQLILNVKLNDERIWPHPNMILIVGPIFFMPSKLIDGADIFGIVSDGADVFGVEPTFSETASLLLAQL